jgi:8-oxo-dGTP pyrophosphatase MutT (NUDIX family)
VEPLFDQLVARLREHPGQPLDLPGVELREAAVLVPLTLRSLVPVVLFTRRQETLRHHAGQISFPGGVRDASDVTPLHTALRELEEELGVHSEDVDVLGMLDEIPPITEFRVVPFVGRLPEGTAFAVSAGEIAELIEVPVAALQEPARQRIERRLVRGAERDIYFFEYAGHTIWGATARIVRNLLDRTEDLPAWKELVSP